MFKTTKQHKLKIALIFFSLILLSNLLLAPQAEAILGVADTTTVVADIPATANWIKTAWEYVRNKVATILFQNLLRKYINDLAVDAAKYLAIGAKGQEKLYIEKKWGDHWEDIADQAAGDFIESFANSIISDIAAEDIKKESKVICDKQKMECYARLGTGPYTPEQTKACEDAYNVCLNSSGDVSAGLSLCSDAKGRCDSNCSQSGPPSTACLNACLATYNACSQNAGGAVEQARRAPMFNGANSPLARLNICNPSLNVSLMISLGLGLSQYYGSQTHCSFSQMKKNWVNEWERQKSLASEDFLENVADNFHPTGSDLGAAFLLNSNLIEYRNKQVINDQISLPSKNGYKDDVNFAGLLKGAPNGAEERKKLADQAVWDNLGKITGDILVDAANIFLNQWAISSWTNLMSNLGSQGGSLSYWTGQQVGRQAIENRLSKLTEPTFSAGGKIDILAQLTACTNPDRPGPTDCVIGNEFSTAIENKMTVAEAVRSGQLPGNWPFGFDKNGEDKIPYNQGYPYRSLIILRKYRILPVGWEVAAQAIQKKYLTNDFADKPEGITLNDLLACYNTNDNFRGYDAPWCRGLVDPNWVLKVPEYYCARQGYGPQLVKDPDLMTTGLKYCSADNGSTRMIVDGKLDACETNDDCCTEAELGARDKLMIPGKEKELRNFSCQATCTYNEQKLLVNRNDNYCADEQGCLKEGRNGACLFRGYCAEEKRSWIFNKNRQDEACDPLFSTCQSFKNPKGQKVSYLTNTLDYGCQQSAIGCKEYSYNGTYNGADNTVNWFNNQNIYLNRKTGACAYKQEGCHEFIRVKDDNGVNLLADGGLEASDDARWSASGDLVNNTPGNQIYQGGLSLKVPAGRRGVYYGPDDKSLLPGGFAFDFDRIYTLSAFVYVVSGSVEMTMGNSADPANAQVIYSSATGEWQNMVLTLLNDNAAKMDFWKISGISPDTEFFVDNMKFEMGSGGQYSAYRLDNLLYEKLLPNYLEDACYQDKNKDFNFKVDAPAKCSEFARKCQADEVGCELYTEVNTKDQTAAQVKPKDYCPNECVGYDTFIQKANNFYSARDEYFIPKTAKTCQANAVGCSLFVNLDKVPSGGEENQYFAKFRRCGQPDDVYAEFYTWEGSDESGYQLVVYQLLANPDKTSGISQPATIDDTNTADNNDGDACNETLYSLPYDHPLYNSDCRQFYGRDGNVSYHLMASTITYSKECHPYRLVNNNIDVSITDQATCEAKLGHWDADKLNCIVCLNGGVWMDDHQACVYLADPTKSQTCSASEVGCSEYEGDFGNQIKILFYDTFEGSLSGWGPKPPVEMVSDSLTVGGHSLKPGGSQIERSITSNLKIGKRYVLSFTAKKKSDNVNISRIAIESDSGFNQAFADNIDITADWKNYKFDLTIPGEQDVVSSKIKFTLGGQGADLRLDNIKILEMSDTYYLIRNSWTTPDSCNQDLFGNPAPLYMLGCEQYKDRSDKTHNLKGFDKLCQDSAVGCELMIDTHNSSFYGEERFNNIVVPADNFAYVVYEKTKECRVADKGCSRLGQYDDLAEAYKDVYLLNDPNNYKDTMCSKDQVGCEAWGLEGGGEAYFKDPGLRTCEYRQPSSASEPAWYKIKTSHCVSADKGCPVDAQTGKVCGNGKYCVTIGADQYCASKFSCDNQSDCSVGTKCQLIDNDERCDPLDYDKTIGLGVREAKVQPVGMAVKDATGKTLGNAGLCPDNQNSCTEYIDPESKVNYDLLTGVVSGKVKLKLDTLYVLKNITNEITISCTKAVNLNQPNAPGNQRRVRLHRLGEDNIITATDQVKTVKQSEEFYIDGAFFADNSVLLDNQPADCTITPPAGAQIREALVNYRLKTSLNQDKPNTVNPDKGQVLFNERAFNGGKYSPLVWDVNASGVNRDGSEQAPQNASNDNENNANALLKVDPDRQCSAWLGCKSYTENPAKAGDKICYERGLCDQMNESGECIHFVSKDPATNQTYISGSAALDISNLTGYSKVGYEGNYWNADLYNLATMKQEGDAKVKFDGSFENAWQTDFVDFRTATTRAPIVSDAKVIEKELGFGSYKIIPDGRAVGKTNEFVVKEVTNAGNRQYIVSAYVFLRYGAKVELTVGRNLRQRGYDPDYECPFESINDTTANLCNATDADGASIPAAVLASTSVAGRWVRLTGKFSISNAYQRNLPSGLERDTRITIGIKPTAGLVYFDDVRLEPGLNIKDDGSANKIKQYLHSDCRLYPEGNAMSCDYFDDSGLRKKGWTGYCLEYDPKNSGTCLLWYPIDKVESEEYEEGVALNIPKDLYYCVDAYDGCNSSNKTQPEFQCQTFIKVDKESYWYSRIAQDSVYSIPANLLTNFKDSNNLTPTSSYFYADFGVNAGGKATDLVLNQQAGSGYYGAYSSLKPPLFDRLSAGNIRGKIMPFVPYYGISQAGLDKNVTGSERRAYCPGNLDSQKQEPLPIEVSDCNDCSKTDRDVSRDLGVYDDCFVGLAVIWEDGATCENNKCGTWSAKDRKCSTPRGPGGRDFQGNNKYEYITTTNQNGYRVWATNDLMPPLNAYVCYDPSYPRGNRHNQTKCELSKDNATSKFTGWATDYCLDARVCGDSASVGCLFECFNHTNFYRLASDIRDTSSDKTASKKRAVEAVKRLFTKVDNESPCYKWNGQSYDRNSASGCGIGNGQVDFALKNCDNNTRPEYNGSNNDYCLVSPTVPRVKLNDSLLSGDKYVLNDSGWVVINFASKIDKDQLPLKKYVINWGYQKNNHDVTLVRNVNMFERPDITNSHQVYYFLSYDEIKNGGGNCSHNNCQGLPSEIANNPAIDCCEIIPKIILTDNWGATNTFTPNSNPNAGPENHPFLDHPLVVWKNLQ